MHFVLYRTKSRGVYLHVRTKPKHLNQTQRLLVKTIVQMKLIALVVLLASTQVSGTVMAQRITLSQTAAPIEQVFSEIRKQANVDFIYKMAQIRKTHPVTIHVTDQPLEKVLEGIFSNQPIGYLLDNQTIIIHDKAAPFPSARPVQQPVQGTVRDSTGVLAGVSVSVRGNAGNGTLTDDLGKFSIQANPDDILVFRYVGYKPQEIAVGGQQEINVVLQPDVIGLDDIVVIGYGTQKRRDLTGAVSSVKTDDLVINSGPEIGNMLKGKVPGLMIRQNSAQPAGGLDILVRGAGSINASNDPLIVVDGFPISDLQQPQITGSRYQFGSQSILNSFNPNDIESIEVLKDASATAIYGSRAANGVILITTKKGKAGTPVVQYSTNFSFQKYEDSFDVLPLNEWMQVRNEAAWEQWNFDNNVIPYGSRTLEEAQANPVSQPFRQLYTQNAINNVGRGTDWLSLVTRNGKTQQHNLSLSGGNEATKYLVSGNYYDQGGIVKNSAFERFTVRANVEQRVHRMVTLGVNLTASQINNKNSQLGADQYENSGIIRAAIQQGPHIQAIDENGNYPLNPQLALQPNPYSLLTITDDGRVERLLLNSFLEVKPFQGLTARFKAGVDRGGSKRETYIPTSTLHGALEQGRAAIASISQDDYLFEGTVDYNTHFAGAHQLTVLVGASRQDTRNTYNNSGNSSFITDAFLWNNLNAGSGTKVVGSSRTENTIASYFGRINYNYNDRYLLTATIRTDGASVFARNNKWGTFPSVALGWNLSEEPFLQNLKTFAPMLKLRVGHGQTGNASIGTNAFAAYSAYPAWLSAEEAIQIGVSLGRLENPNLKWETTTETNIGLDFSIFKGRVDGSVDVYNKVISDLLAEKPINSYHQVNTIMANIGKTQSRGFEVALTTHNIRNQYVHWRTMLAVSKYVDRWKERADDWKPAVYERVDDPIRAQFYRPAEAIQQVNDPIPDSQPELRPGMIRLKDVDGFKRDANGNPEVDENGRFIRTGQPDGILDDADTRLLGTSDPGLIAGFTNIVTYKNWTLNIDFNGMFGRRMEDPNYVTYGIGAVGVYQNGYNALRTVKDRWTPERPSATQPSSFWGYSPYGAGDFFLEDAWFIRLQNVSLEYSLPTRWVGKVFSEAAINATASNLFVITPYKGVDPETDSYTAAYPNIRTFTLGVRLKL